MGKPKQTRLSFGSIREKQPSETLKIKEQKNAVQAKHIVVTPKQPKSFVDDPRVATLLKQWSDGSPTYHQEGLNVVDKLMRQFDNRPEYGPSSRISRLERWERASELDLQPPAVIKEILTSNEHLSESIYS